MTEQYLLKIKLIMKSNSITPMKYTNKRIIWTPTNHVLVQLFCIMSSEFCKLHHYVTQNYIFYSFLAVFQLYQGGNKFY